MPAHLRFTRPSLLGLLAAVAVLVGSTAYATFDGPLAITDKGLVRGNATPTLNEFLGIPYAAPPVGDLRWRPPQPVEKWRGVRDATQFANHCPQPPTPFGTLSLTEDCLYLNVYTPKKAPPGRRPVMVWIHGGALFLGESDEYDPTRLVEQGVVVVTINYRLGILGFLAHPELTAESSYGGSGNYGIMDQQAALRWVQRNIFWFGGDPHNVTVFGQSAGGLSTHTHLASPESAGLFDRAIVLSGAYALDQPPLAAAQNAGMAFAASVGCTDQTASCLRGVAVPLLLANQGGAGFIPNLDNQVLTQTIRSAFTSGNFNQVPVIEGSTHDEWRLFVGLDELAGGPLTAAGYPAAIASTLGVPLPVATFIATTLYPLANYPSPSIALGAVGTDAIFACNARAAVGLLSQHVPTFAYEFNDPSPPETLLPPLSFPLGAYHASEVQYLFDTNGFPTADILTPDQQKLSDTMVDYWTQFAWLGNPNFFGTPLWRRYDAARDEVQSLVPGSPSAVVKTDFAADHQCGFWTAPAL